MTNPELCAAVAGNPPPLRWTTEPPTEPGWYWWREPCSVTWNVCEIYHGSISSRPLFVRNGGRVDNLPTFVMIYGAGGPGGRRLEWAGPIPEPSE